MVRQPDFFTAMVGLLNTIPLDDWKVWMKWHLLHEAAPVLSKPFVDENFAFFGRTLTGAPVNRPRWKRGVAFVAEAMGEAVGKEYVAKRFPPAAKTRMQELVGNLTAAYRENITEPALDEPGDATKGS